MKICDPPELGMPVFAIERVPFSFEMGSISSSGMLPPVRVMVVPSGVVYVLPGSGPPVPARGDFGSFECGQPNWHMKPWITRWNVRPS